MILKDEKLGKYEIHHDGDNYSVVEKTGVDKKGKDVFKTYAYCSSIQRAIEKIVKLKVETKESIYDLKVYLKSITETNESILKALKQ